MNLSKLRIIHIAIIGAVVCILVGVSMYVLMITKAQERLAAETATRDKYQPTGTPTNIQNQKDAYSAAIAKVVAEQAKYDRYMARKMPVLDFSDRESGMMALWYEQGNKLGPALVKWLKDEDVAIDNSTRITIPAPVSNPNELISDPLTPIMISLGKITVQGSFKQIITHINKWNTFNRLVLVDNVALKGVSPNLECSYDATLYIFPTRHADPANLLPMAGVPGAANAAAGGVAGTVPATNPQPVGAPR